MITLIFTLVSALYDDGKRFTNHIPRFIFRAIAVLLISYFESGNFLTNALLNIAVFYATFDYMLNYLEDRKWNYIGSTAIHDIIRSKYLGGWIPQFIFKLLFLTISIYLKCTY